MNCYFQLKVFNLQKHMRESHPYSKEIRLPRIYEKLHDGQRRPDQSI
jgi:hypothetical protein